MGQSLTKTEFGTSSTQATNVGEMTSQLLDTIRQSNNLGSRDGDLVEDLLACVAEADQLLAEQRAQIDELKSKALCDDLTGLPNRHAFELALEQTIANAVRYEEEGLVALFDLQCLKAIEDKYGYEAGETYLTEVADLLSSGTRATDHVARIEDNKFVIVFTRADEKPVRARAMAIKVLLNVLAAKYGCEERISKVKMRMGTYDSTSKGQDLLQYVEAAFQDISLIHSR